jgi:hypothetical protein
MEPEASSPYSQQPSTGPYPEPDKSNPDLPTLFLLRSILILISHLHLGLPSGLFPLGFAIKMFVYFSHISHSCYMPRPSHPPWFNHPNNVR